LAPALALLFSMLILPAYAQTVDSTSFEGTWGSFSPKSDAPDEVSPQLVTTLAHSGRYSVEATASNGQQSFMGNWYGGSSPVPVPYQVTFWVYVKSQLTGHLEFAKLWGFLTEEQARSGAAFWLAALLRSSEGYAMIRSSEERTSSYFISMETWHKYSTAYDGTTLRLYVDDTLVFTDDSVGGQKYVGAVNLGVLDDANSLSSSKLPSIGHGTVYIDDYSLERAVSVTTPATAIPAYLYWSLPIVAVVGAVVAYALLSFRKRRPPRRVAEPAKLAIRIRDTITGDVIEKTVEPSRTVGLLVQDLVREMNLPEDRQYTLAFKGREIGPENYSVALHSLGMKNGDTVEIKPI